MTSPTTDPTSTTEPTPGPTIDPDSPPPASAATNDRRGRNGRRWVLTAAAVVVVVGAGLVLARLASGWFSPHLYAGTVFQESSPAAPMDGLTFSDGSPVDLAAFEGEAVLVYFGYTNCPDVCPTTLSAAARSLDLLGDRGDDVEVLMVSIDPERDDPALLEDYVDFFHPRFAGVSGSVDDLDRVASLYGVFYQLGEGSPDSGYTVDHTASLMGIGPDGSLRVVWPSGVTAEELAADVNELLS